MDQKPSEQLDKVLALADSSHEAEAIVAVRKARQMLSRDGLSFADLAHAAMRRPGLNRVYSIFSGPQVHLETQIIRLRQKLDDLQADLQSQAVQLEFWRRRAAELEQHFNLSQSEAERWRQLARDTVEKLWDLGQEVCAEEFASDAPAADESDQKTA
jgi:hypothetical protein